MTDMQPQLSQDPNHEDIDLDDARDVRCYISQSSSPISEEPQGLSIAYNSPLIAQESPPKIKIYNDEDTSADNTEYIRPRVRISSEHELSSLDEIEFSEDEAGTPCTPALIERRFVDTSAPIESVKHAVSRFGGTVDWKSRKNRSFEKRKNIDHELEKTQEEIPLFKQQTEAAEEAKTQVLNDLEATNQLIEELEISLDRAMVEEDQAKQDYEGAEMKVKEMEISELKCVREELETLRKEYSLLLNEKEAASMKAEEAVLASKNVEKTVEELSKELVSTKEIFESTRSAQLEGNETQSWEMEMKKAEEEIDELKRQMEVEKELKEKLNAACGLIASLESELAGFNESSTDSVAKHELEEMKFNTEKATDEVKRLKEVSISLKSELENEKSELAKLKQREDMASLAVASLEAELERMKSEIRSVQMREKEAVDLPEQLQMASQEADEAKSEVKAAREALRKAKEEADQAKAGVVTVEKRLSAAQKEIEAARVSEKQAMDSIKILQTQNDSPDRVIIPLEEYNELIKQAQEAEEQANTTMAEALAQIEAAKEEKSKTVKKLEEANRELSTRKEVYKAASSKAEKANEAKLIVEQELRNWRSDHEQRRKADVSPRRALAPLRIGSSSRGSGRSDTSSPGKGGLHDSVESSPDVKGWRKKKKQFFPRFLTFFNKKKHSSKT